MAAPATKTSQDLSGQWGLNKQLSDNPEPALQLQGIGFLTRKAIGVASISIEINQYSDKPTPPSTSTDPATFLSVGQSASGLKGTSELRVLDGEIRDHTDWLFGSLKCHSRWVNVDDITESEWLKQDWEEGERLVRTHVKNHKNGWEAIQICGFQEILQLAVRTQSELLQAAYNLPHVQLRPEVKSISLSQGGGVTVTLVDGEITHIVDHLIFATGYRFSYPYLKPDLVASTKESNRVTGLYRHVFNIEDPTLAFVGKVKAGLSFRVNEYQAVAIARFLVGRSAGLPSKEDQRKWQVERLAFKWPSSNFHEILPDFEPYFKWMAEFAGESSQDSNGYRLSKWQDSLAEEGLALLEKKAKYWQSIIDSHNRFRAKL